MVVDPPILQAPMAGFTNAAFRQIVREFGGAGLLATEMVNARGFVWMDEHEAEHPDRLWGVADEARPLAVQIWDNDPETMAKVGKRLVEEYQVSVVDINFGCPVRQVTEKAHSGSYLLREPQRMFRNHQPTGRSLQSDPGDRQDSTWLHPRQCQLQRSGSGRRRGRCGGADGSWPNRPRHVSRQRRLGADQRNQVST